MKPLITILFFLCAFTMNAQTHDVTSPTRQKPTTTAAKPKPQTAHTRKTNPAKPTPAKPSQTTGPKLSKSSGSYGGHDYVDLGLPSGTLWATCNVGASKPTEHGGHFAWGETKSKKFYDWDTYYYYTGDSGTPFRKYNDEDGKTELDLSDDVAYVNWGDGWRMPSKAQQDELLEKCIWTWYSKNGVCGYVVESKYNEGSIFLPASGFYKDGALHSSNSYYWSRSLGPSRSAYDMGFHSNNPYPNRNEPCMGMSVRPVRR